MYKLKITLKQQNEIYEITNNKFICNNTKNNKYTQYEMFDSRKYIKNKELLKTNDFIFTKMFNTESFTSQEFLTITKIKNCENITTFKIVHYFEIFNSKKKKTQVINEFRKNFKTNKTKIKENDYIKIEMTRN